MEGLRKTEPEGISSVIEGGRHDEGARRSKLCLGKRGDRRVGEALEEGSFGPSKPPSASFPESLQRTSSVCSCVWRSLPSWDLSVPFSDEGERASGSPQLLVRMLWGDSGPGPVLCSYLQKPLLSVLRLSGCWSGSQFCAAEQDPVGDKERTTLIRIDLEARPLSLLFLCHQTRSQTLLWILPFNPQNYPGSEESSYSHFTGRDHDSRGSGRRGSRLESSRLVKSGYDFKPGSFGSRVHNLDLRGMWPPTWFAHQLP